MVFAGADPTLTTLRAAAQGKVNSAGLAGLLDVQALVNELQM